MPRHASYPRGRQMATREISEAFARFPEKKQTRRNSQRDAKPGDGHAKAYPRGRSRQPTTSEINEAARSLLRSMSRSPEKKQARRKSQRDAKPEEEHAKPKEVPSKERKREDSVFNTVASVVEKLAEDSDEDIDSDEGSSAADDKQEEEATTAKPFQRTRWSSNDDKKVLKLMDAKITNRKKLTAALPGRTLKAIQKRYRDLTTPGQVGGSSKSEWTPEDYELLLSLKAKGYTWDLIRMKAFNHRSVLALRLKYFKLKAAGKVKK